MSTAGDTNILLDIVRPNEDFFASSLRSLEEAAQAGSLAACDLVYAELCVHFNQQDDCDRFLDEAQVRVETLSREAGFLASRVWRNYRKQGGKRNRILADFLIGAHAQEQASRLLSRDRGFYRSMFPGLRVIEPAEAN